MLHKYSIVQNFREPIKATETAVDIVSKNSHVGFVNYSGLKFSPDFLNTQRSRHSKNMFFEKSLLKYFANLTR